MPRNVRVEYAGACYHVINRGNYRGGLFAGRGAAEAFQGCLFEAAARFGWRVHAFVIMRDHFHLALETPEPNLSDGMKWLQGTWAARFCRARGMKGRPFQGRFKALHVEPGPALAQVAHYLHLNPVRAGVVRAGRLLEYRWSSLPWLVAKRRPAVLVADTVLSESGLADTAAGWRSYVAHLGVLAEEEPRVRDKRYGRMSRGWAIGSAEFKAGLRREVTAPGRGRRRVARLEAARAVQREMRATGWEKQLQAAARALEVNLKRLPPMKSAAEKVQVAALLKATTSVSNGWLAERLEMGTPASASQFVRRFRVAGGAEKPKFRAALARVQA